MQKFIKILALTSAIFLIGCNSNKEKTPEVTPETTKTETTKTPDKKTGDVTYSKSKNIDILSQAQKNAVVSIYSPENTVKWKDIESLFTFQDVGEINNGKYKGQRLILGIQGCDGICFREEIYRYAYDSTNKKLTLLIKHSSEQESEFFEMFADKTDTSTELEGLSLPEKIKIAGTDQYIILDQKDVMEELDTEYYNNVIFTDPEFGDVYFQYSKDIEEDYRKQGCLYVKAPDGTVSQYRYDPRLFETKGKTWINWENGDKSTNLTDNYNYEDTACGFGGMCYVISTIDDKKLTLVGKTTTDVEIYEDQNLKGNEKLEEFYAIYKNNQETLKSPGEPSTNFTLEEFAKTHPLLYWKDPFNRWSKLISKAAKPPAECGKPVIYLYPTETTDVNVKVGIAELTETIPTYPRNGWTVSANPDGQLYNYDDGQNYPYLYWEGQGEGTSSPEKGFVVARNDVENFLDDSLDKLGLNSQEKADFNEFWVERILANREPYFFFSFMGTSDFNKVAPLSITPAPDTLIRIFMYYKPLNSELKVQPQTLRAIQRRGFTVVEWGGTSTVQWEK